MNILFLIQALVCTSRPTTNTNSSEVINIIKDDNKGVNDDAEQKVIFKKCKKRVNIDKPISDSSTNDGYTSPTSDFTSHIN